MPKPLSCGPGHEIKIDRMSTRVGQICFLPGNPPVKDGPFELRDMNGDFLVQTGTYKNGNIEGTSRFYSRFGNLESEIDFERGIMRKQRFFVAFDPRIKIKDVTLDEKGKFYGSRFWNLKGQVITETQSAKLAPMWANMEEGKVEIAKLYKAASAFIAKHKTMVSDLVAVGYTPFGQHRYACGFTKPSAQNVKLPGFRINNQRFNSMNKTFKAAAGKKFKFTGRSTLPDFPSTYIEGAKFRAACVARFGNEKDAWIVDETGTIRHDSTLLN